MSLTSTSVVTIVIPDRRNCAMSAATRLPNQNRASSGDRQAGVQRTAAAPGPALSPGQSAGTGPPSARLHRRDECGLPAVMKGFRYSL